MHGRVGHLTSREHLRGAMPPSFPAASRGIPGLGRTCRAHREPISITVDASQTVQKLLHAKLIIPVKPGPLDIYYPKWLPGGHGPQGPITNLTGLKFEADGKIISWQRDLLDVFTFHVDVPAGANHLDISYDYIEPDGNSATDKLMDLEWNETLLYPAGVPANQLIYEAKLILPPLEGALWAV